MNRDGPLQLLMNPLRVGLGVALLAVGHVTARREGFSRVSGYRSMAGLLVSLGPD